MLRTFIITLLALSIMSFSVQAMNPLPPLPNPAQQAVSDYLDHVNQTQSQTQSQDQNQDQEKQTETKEEAKK